MSQVVELSEPVLVDRMTALEWHWLAIRLSKGFSEAPLTITVLPRLSARGSGDGPLLVLNLNNTTG